MLRLSSVNDNEVLENCKTCKKIFSEIEVERRRGFEECVPTKQIIKELLDNFDKYDRESQEALMKLFGILFN